jgi:hypothetical protein
MAVERNSHIFLLEANREAVNSPRGRIVAYLPGELSGEPRRNVPLR